MSAAGGKIVAVCGATGKQGGGVVAALQKLGGFKVRALTRNPDSPSAAKLRGPDVEVVKADFEDPASLREAFKGCDAVFAVTDFWVACQTNGDREVQQGKNLVDAAKAAGVKHFVWSTLEDTRRALAGKREPVDAAGRIVPHFDAKAEIEQYLREQLPDRWTTVYTSIYYENLVPGGGMDPKPQPDGSFLLALPCGNAKMAWCAASDIGKVVAPVIAGGPERFASQHVSISGNELTLPEVAEIVSRVFGKKVVPVMPPADDWIKILMGFGVPQAVATDLANMWVFYDTVDMRGLRPAQQTKELAPDVLGLEAWLNQNKDKFATLFA